MVQQNLKVLSLFSGIGAYEKALRNIGINHEVVNYCELDDKAGKCYSLLYNIPESLNLKDVSKIDISRLPDFDLLVFSPPCQDISTIGGHAGAEVGTRTGLMWDCLDIIKAKSPSYFVMENVQNLIKKYKGIFTEYLNELRSFGYNCESEIIDASKHGIPQKRKRLFVVGVKQSLNFHFSWPNSRPLKLFLKDFIEPGERIDTINKEVAYTIRVGGRKSGISNRHNWDGYLVNGKEYFLSAKDCIRLMGFDLDDYYILKNSGISDSTILKVAGNSVVVPILEDIFISLLKKKESLFMYNQSEEI